MKQRIKDLLIWGGMFYQFKDLTFYQNPVWKQQLNFYRQLIDPHDLVFDVGGNIGQRAKIFADIGRKVVVFEPQPYCIRQLRSRFRYIPKIKLEPIALNNTVSTEKMYLSSSHTISTLSRHFIETAGKTVFKNETYNQEIDVETNTLDNMIERYGLPAFLKIDTEGFEINVLQGLKDPVPVISFEFMPDYKEEAMQCLEYLHQLSPDYRYNYTSGENLNFVLPEHLSYEDFIRNGSVFTASLFGDIYAILDKSQHQLNGKGA